MIPYHEHIKSRIMKNYSRFVTTLAILFTISIGLKAQCLPQCFDQVPIQIDASGTTQIPVAQLVQLDLANCSNEDISIQINGISQTITDINGFIEVDLVEGFYQYETSLPNTGESCWGSFLLGDVNTGCVDTLILEIGDAIGIDQVEIPVTALNAMLISSMQFTFAYDGSILAFNDVIPGAITDISGGANFFEIQPGRLNFSWFDTSGGANPAILNNNTVLYTLVFDVLLNGNTSITIDPFEPSILQEVINENLEQICLNYGVGNITVNGALITGSIQNNDLLDCLRLLMHKAITIRSCSRETIRYKRILIMGSGIFVIITWMSMFLL